MKTDNLKPFKPGQSGNYNGRPKKLPNLDKLLADVFGENELEKLLKAVYAKAMKGDTRAAEIILDRGYGKPKQHISLESEEPIKSFTIKTASDKGTDSK